MFMGKYRATELVNINTKKPAKGSAMNDLLQLINQMPEQMYEDNKLMIAGLLTFFTPPVPKTPKDNFSWVVKAVETSPVTDREWTRHILVTDDHIIATDGHRLHVAENDGMKPGFYDPKTRIETGFTGKYLCDFDTIQSKFLSKNSVQVDFHWEKRKVDIRQMPFVAMTKDVEGNDYAFNLKYMEDALCGFNDVKQWMPGTGDSYAVIQQDGRIAILMPFRL